jgi:hypothetical protein
MLDLSNTPITEVPPWLTQCDQLKVLRLSMCTRCTGFSSGCLAGFQNLRFVDLSGVGIVGKSLNCGPATELVVRVGASQDERPEGNVRFIT